ASSCASTPVLGSPVCRGGSAFCWPLPLGRCGLFRSGVAAGAIRTPFCPAWPRRFGVRGFAVFGKDLLKRFAAARPLKLFVQREMVLLASNGERRSTKLFYSARRSASRRWNALLERRSRTWFYCVRGTDVR